MAAIIENQIQQIKSTVIEMMVLARKQVTRTQEALFNFDKELTEEILISEKKLNALDLKIDKDAEQTLALYNPLADDLRLIISVLSINTYLERIGDNSASIAKFINSFEEQFDQQVFNDLRLMEMFEHILFMFDIVVEAFEKEETSLAVKVFKIDRAIDEINQAATKVIADAIRKSPAKTESFLDLISVVRKMERVGDLLKNVAEETIFYVDAKILKHKTKKKNKMIDNDEA
jgi:phosphate transport system protein